MVTAHVEVRSKHAKRGRSGFAGPGMRVSVQVVPEGVKSLTVLDGRVATKRGIQVLTIGEGYWNHRGPKSMLGKAIAEAEDLATRINACNYAGVIWEG